MKKLFSVFAVAGLLAMPGMSFGHNEAECGTTGLGSAGTDCGDQLVLVSCVDELVVDGDNCLVIDANGVAAGTHDHDALEHDTCQCDTSAE